MLGQRSFLFAFLSASVLALAFLVGTTAFAADSNIANSALQQLSSLKTRRRLSGGNHLSAESKESESSALGSFSRSFFLSPNKPSEEALPTQANNPAIPTALQTAGLLYGTLLYTLDRQLYNNIENMVAMLPAGPSKDYVSNVLHNVEALYSMIPELQERSRQRTIESVPQEALKRQLSTVKEPESITFNVLKAPLAGASTIASSLISRANDLASVPILSTTTNSEVSTLSGTLDPLGGVLSGALNNRSFSLDLPGLLRRFTPTGLLSPATPTEGEAPNTAVAAFPTRLSELFGQLGRSVVNPFIAIPAAVVAQVNQQQQQQQ